MAELSTLARPYARAAFEFALAGGSLAAWSDALALAAAIVRDAKMSAVLTSPNLTSEQMADTMSEVCGEALDSDQRNFIAVLADNKRLLLLPEISVQFEHYKAEQERSIDVEVLSAFELGEAAEQRLREVLSRKLEREVNVASRVDDSLLGGVLIRAGDLVIDGSVRGRLNKLAEAMNS